MESAAIHRSLVAAMRLLPFSSHQCATVLIAVAVEMGRAHASNCLLGPVHPSRVWIDTAGRPHVNDLPAPPGWSKADDLISLRRFAGGLSLGDFVTDDVRLTLNALLELGVQAVPLVDPAEPVW